MLVGFVHYSTYTENDKEIEADIAYLIASLSGLEEKLMALYNHVKASWIGTVAAVYLLDDGVH